MLSALPINVKLAFASMWAKKIRSVLTILGVMIGVFAITTLLGIGEGVKASVTKEVEGIGTNLIFVLPGKVDASGGFDFQSSLGASTLTSEDVTRIRSIDHVAAVSPISLASGLVKAGDRPASGLLVLGTTPENLTVRDLTLTVGRFLEPLDESKEARVVVLGSGAADVLFPDGSAFGSRVTFRDQPFDVVGVLEQTQTPSLFGGPNFDNAVYFPFSTLADVTGSSQIFRIAAKVDAADDVAAAKQAIHDALLAEHGGQEDFTVFTQDDLLKIFNSVLQILTAMVSAIAGISLLVGGIGIMNIMLVSVTERTKEIGLRKAIGAGAGDIFLQFFTESILLSLFGGAAGIGASVVASRIIESRVDLIITFTPLTVGLAVGFALFVGVLFGVAPAIRAARMSPIEALKYE